MSMGRPTKCTPERQKTICDALRDGVSIEGAAALAGCDDSAYYRWMQKGADAVEREEDGHTLSEREERYRDFYDAATRAIAESEAALVRMVRAQAPQDWRAAVEMLKRRFPQHWSEKRIHEMQGPGGGPIRTAGVSLETDDPQELQQMYQELFSEEE